MSIYSKFKTNDKAEVDGIKVKFKANDDGTFPIFVISRVGGKNSVKWNKSYEKFVNLFTDANPDRKPNEDEANDILVKTFSECCIISWSNINDENDKPMECTFENSVKLLKDLPELFEVLYSKASNYESFLQSKMEKIEKN